MNKTNCSGIFLRPAGSAGRWRFGWPLDVRLAFKLMALGALTKRKEYGQYGVRLCRHQEL